MLLLNWGILQLVMSLLNVLRLSIVKLALPFFPSLTLWMKQLAIRLSREKPQLSRWLSLRGKDWEGGESVTHYGNINY